MPLVNQYMQSLFSSTLPSIGSDILLPSSFFIYSYILSLSGVLLPLILTFNSLKTTYCLSVYSVILYFLYQSIYWFDFLATIIFYLIFEVFHQQSTYHQC